MGIKDPPLITTILSRSLSNVDEVYIYTIPSVNV
jgi:hypothetical protein